MFKRSFWIDYDEHSHESVEDRDRRQHGWVLVTESGVRSQRLQERWWLGC